ncbi:VWA domain-containing protein [Williamsia sterculiae]|uniref:Magnesium chelatase subunit D n=1 Tax=Williamsia sterculiae TaxID=1344003 RepID=A0A1N7GE14_9NOCA|nr:VWA domain-containing protein [Williamsia sterculiae]SIS10865.1 magnesium chelatase subunit D [Williamsia sterculiae]
MTTTDHPNPAGHPESSAPVRFPFSALVGQDALKRALVLSAVDPAIGGVLIRGEKGTAKSTAVRGLGRLLAGATAAARPGASTVVELPIGATEDRVVGSIDLESALHEGRATFSPGLLAQADGGILYIDEVNLLADHLVDVLLDAAASGHVVVERDGVSASYPSRFVLVGTMNAEEGELRPQLLDRFGLAVDVSAPDDVDTRVEVVTRRLAFDADPVAFDNAYAAQDDSVSAAIVAARESLPAVQLGITELRRIAAICADLGVDGMRGDIVVARAARAHAAWRGATAVTSDDVRAAVELALPHRRRRDPFDAPGLSDDEVDDLMESASTQVDEPARADPPGDAAAAPDPVDPDDDPNGPGGGAPAPGPQAPPPAGPTTAQQSPDTSSDDDRAPAPSGALRIPDQQGRLGGGVGRALRARGLGEGDPGRRSPARTRRGRAIRGVVDGGTGVHLPATVLAAVERTAGVPRPDGRVRIAPGDLRSAQRVGREGNLVVFAVDLSGSMAARRRLDAVTAACVDLLRDSYQRRDRVAVVVFRGDAAEVAVPPTGSVDVAVRRLTGLRTGGRTPLAEGLLAADDVIRRAAVGDPHRRPILVVLTDGRATAGTDPRGRADTAADRLRERGATVAVVDCEEGFVRLGLAGALAARLRATVLRLDDLTGTTSRSSRIAA